MLSGHHQLFEKRRALVEAWPRYCDGAEVVSFAIEVRSASLSG